ncbi:HD domain-containing protein [archaeon]|nr:HD domain-containing protein [archaeon]
MLKLFEYFKLDDRVKELFDRVRAELISRDKDQVWEHTLRVIKNLYKLREEVEFNFKVALIAAICHDIGYNEVIDGHEQASALLMKKLLNQSYDNKMVGEIIHCIESHEADGPIKPQTTEAIALHDADMMDYLSERGVINAFLVGRNVGLNDSATSKRIVKVIEEGFMIKELKNKYEKELRKTEKFFIELTKDLITERKDFLKYGMHNI